VTPANGEPWYLPAYLSNSTHLHCLDGSGLLEDGGELQLLDVSLGLISPPAHLSLSEDSPAAVMEFDDTNATALDGQEVEYYSPAETSWDLEDEEGGVEGAYQGKESQEYSPVIKGFEQRLQVVVIEE
jgi:hypothetical protein